MKKNLQDETIKALMSESRLNEAKDSEIVTIKYRDDEAFYNLDTFMSLEKKYDLNVGVKQVKDGAEVTVTGTKANIKAFNREYNGINAEELTDEDLDAMVVESKKVEDVTPDKEYQGIKYFDNQDGWCPVCNAHLHYEPIEYGGTNEDGDSVAYCGWTCDKCGTKGEAYFKQSFIGHSVYDDNFDLIDLPFGETKTESKQDDEIKSLRDEIPLPLIHILFKPLKITLPFAIAHIFCQRGCINVGYIKLRSQCIIATIQHA